MSNTSDNMQEGAYTTGLLCSLVTAVCGGVIPAVCSTVRVPEADSNAHICVTTGACQVCRSYGVPR